MGGLAAAQQGKGILEHSLAECWLNAGGMLLAASHVTRE
jgi:hypothetical protein